MSYIKERIKYFQGATGTLDTIIDSKELLLSKLKARYDFLLEEVEELKEAIDERDIVKAVDAVGDIEVFHQQYVIDLEAAGIHYAGAINAICDNNDSKYSTNEKFIEEKLSKTFTPCSDQMYVDANTYDGFTFYCLKHWITNKVKKWAGFEPVNLREFIPKHLLED